MTNNQKLYILFGNVSSGKSTLAKRLSEHFGGVPHLSSDAIREELTGNINGNGKAVFPTMRNRLLGHLAGGDSVILDSTGQSPKYVALVNEFRGKIPTHVIQLHSDKNAWTEREKQRTDRWTIENGKKVPMTMPEEAYVRSSNVKIQPDLKIDTTHLTPDDVFQQVLTHIGDTKNGLDTSNLSEAPKG